MRFDPTHLRVRRDECTAVRGSLRRKRRRARGAFLAVMLWALAALLSSGSDALVTHRLGDPSELQESLAGSGDSLSIRSLRLQHHEHRNGAVSIGTFEEDALLGLGSGIVLSTGDVSDYGAGANTGGAHSTVFGQRTTTDQQNLAQQIIGAGAQTFDATQLDFVFDVAPNAHGLSLQVAFGSEEWPEYSEERYVDGFGVFLNGSLIYGADGLAQTANHPDAGSFGGTELDAFIIQSGIPVLEIAAELDPGSTGNILTFLIFDTADSSLDSTAYVSNLVANPEPGTGILLGLGLLVLARRRRN